MLANLSVLADDSIVNAACAGKAVKHYAYAMPSQRLTSKLPECFGEHQCIPLHK